MTLSRCLALFLLIWNLCSAALAQERSSVLVIQSYHGGYEWDAAYTGALRELLADTVELTFFEMDTKRRPPTEYPQRAELAWQTYLRAAPDLVILGDDNALKFLGPRLAETDTPVIYLGINDNPRRYFSTLPRNMTGILERPLLSRSILYMQQLMPQELKRVLVLFDSGTTSRAAFQEAFQGERQLRVGPVAVTVELIDTLEQWQAAVDTAPAKGFDAIVIGLYHTLTNERGLYVPAQEVIQWSSTASRLPLFAFWRFAVGEKMTIGGLVLDGEAQGQAAAQMALKVLAGEPFSLMPQSSGPGRFVFSRAQLKRWQIQVPDKIAEQASFVP